MLVILLPMQEGLVNRLTQSFSASALQWRVVRLSDDHTQAQVRPQLAYAEVIARLNSVLTPTGWSNRYYPVGSSAVGCDLSIAELVKACVVPLNDARGDAATCAQDALVYAAEGFGLVPPADTGQVYWVDYDAETRVALHEPSLEPVAKILTPALDKPAGQQAIDRLVERLRQEGLGLEAAKLVMNYGGYGDDAEAARELYSKLRTLLLNKESLPL